MTTPQGFQDAFFAFTYTFLLEPPIDLIKLAAGARRFFSGKLPRGAIRVRDGSGDGDHVEAFLALRCPECDVPFGPYQCDLQLRLYDETRHRYVRRVIEGLSLSWQVRVLQSGVGTVTFYLGREPSWEVGIGEAIAISRAATVVSPQAEAGRLAFGPSSSITRLFPSQRERGTFFGLFCGTVRNLAKGARIRWAEIAWKMVVPGAVFANPYVTIRLELPSQVATVGDLLSDTNWRNDLARVVLRVRQEWKQVNQSYVARQMDSLASCTPHDRYWLSLHLRSCTYMYCMDAYTADGYPRAYFRSLLDTIELLRAQWHAYTVYGEYLDGLLHELSGPDVLARWTSARSVLSDIAKARRQLASCLESPISHKRAAGSLQEVFAQGLDVFGIERLEALVLRKLQMVDRLYSDLLELSRAAELSTLLPSKLP
jgi:hypothetical protein